MRFIVLAFIVLSLCSHHTWAGPGVDYNADYHCLEGSVYFGCSSDLYTLCVAGAAADGVSEYLYDSWDKTYGCGFNVGEFSYYNCPTPGHEFNDETQECELPPPDCSNDQYLDTQGQCQDSQDALDDCSSSGGMRVWSQANNEPGECINSQCSNVTGKAKFDPTFDYCQEYEDECDQRGGTYGAVGSSSGTAHFCLTDEGEGLPTCASGSQYYYESDDLSSSSFACTPTTPPSDQCDATLYDCDEDGNVDDQDGDGVVDNGTENLHDDGLSSGDITNPPDPNDPFSGENVGNDELDPAVKGAGDCDPTSRNYAECIGMTSPESTGLSEADSNNLADITSAVTATGTAPSAARSTDTVEGSTNTFVSALSGVPVVLATQNLATSFSGSGSCPAPNFDAFGETFTIDYHCTLYSEVSGMLSLVFMAIWTIAAVRWMLSA